MTSFGPDTVFPAQAGIQGIQAGKLWIPACAGMTRSACAGMTRSTFAGMTKSACAGMTTLLVAER